MPNTWGTFTDNVAVSRSPRWHLFLNWSPDSSSWSPFSFSNAEVNEAHVDFFFFLDQLRVHLRNTSKRDPRRRSLRTCEKQSVSFVGCHGAARTSVSITNLGNACGRGSSAPTGIPDGHTCSRTSALALENTPDQPSGSLTLFLSTNKRVLTAPSWQPPGQDSICLTEI